MFNSTILKNKPNKLDEDLQPELVILGARVINSLEGIRANSFTQVKEGEQARPDLVSMRMYGSQDYQDELCKMNGISNPYSLDVEDALVVPNVIQFSLNVSKERDETPVVQQDNDVRLSFKSIDQPKPSSVQKFNDSFQKTIEEMQMDGSGLPPTLADFGDKQFIVKGGKVIFAPNIGNCVTNDNQPISKGELVSKLIKNRLLG